MPDDNDEMDVPEVIRTMNEALRLQWRSVIQYTIAAGASTGISALAVSPTLAAFGRAELDDARRMVEKVVTLDGTPSAEVAPVTAADAGTEMLALLIATETEAVDALQKVIPPSGQEGRSEALEHLIEHIIERKQEQIDTLERARR